MLSRMSVLGKKKINKLLFQEGISMDHKPKT